MNTSPIPVLIADIGGTNARLSIVIIEKNKPIIEIDKKTYTTYAHKNLKTILSNYISSFKSTDNFPVFAVLGLPGAIINNKVVLSHALSHLNGTTGEEMAKSIGIRHVLYLNDFNVNGYSIQCKELENNVDYVQINEGVEPVENSTKVMVGAGTGLGTGYLTKTPVMKYYSVHSSEGGQQDFAPTTELQGKYREFIKKILNVQCPSVEMACCGSSISTIYRFFESLEQMDCDKGIASEMKKAIGDKDKLTKLNEKIIEYGTKNKCQLCKRVVDFFLELYGSICGNIAISMLPFGGVYLLGGVSSALAEYMKRTDIFMSNFVNKAGLNLLLEKIPVYIIINKNLGVSGAAIYAQQLIEEGTIDNII